MALANSQFLWPTFGFLPSYVLGKRLNQAGNIVVDDENAITTRFESKTFDFASAATAPPTVTAPTYNVYPGYDNLLRLQLDQTSQAAQTGLVYEPLQSYLLSAVMVAPLDIRIEAGLYAQDKSFFIIPGYSFNPDANDIRSRFNSSHLRPAYTQVVENPPGTFNYIYNGVDTAADKDAKDKFPYHNEPLDVRITFQGAIAENYTASVGAQAAWLKQWGYAPAKYGSYNAANPTATEIPDDHLMARDPGPSGTLPVGYVAGDPGNLDFRTPLEAQTDTGGPGGGPTNDFKLTRALRFEYDPKFAMPYFHSTDASPGSGLTGQANRNRRLGRALRFLTRTVQYSNTSTFVFRQVLPPLPRLPVSPDLIYSGKSDQLLGENQFDTDLYTP